MSTLTKVFVLLLVLLSIVQTAGIVVFVNREQSFAVTFKAQNDKIGKLEAEAGIAQQKLDEETQQFTQLQAISQNAHNLYSQTTEQLRGAVAEKDGNIAQLTSQSQLAMAAQKGATDALAVAQKSIDSQNQQLADLRKTNTDLQKNTADSNIALAEMTNKFDTVNRQWKDEMEQNAQLKNHVGMLGETLRRNGIAENSDRVINQTPAIKVEGVVRSRTTANGVQMATISIGSSDQVTQGMRLAIIDPTASDPFLGYIEVDRVEPNSAVGHIFGPHVDRVRQGAEVRSQL